MVDGQESQLQYNYYGMRDLCERTCVLVTGKEAVCIYGFNSHRWASSFLRRSRARP